MGILIFGLFVGTVCGIAIGLRRGKSLQSFVSEERTYRIIKSQEMGEKIEITFADALKEESNGSPFLATVIIEKSKQEIIFIPALPEYSSEKERVKGTGPAFAL
mgnify:CR=1 FL=1